MQQQKRLLTLVGIIILSGIIVFAYFNSRQYFTGPQIIIYEPDNGLSFDSPSVTLRGKALNTAFIKLNGNPVYINEHNEFNEKLLLPPGTSIMKLEATDRFERRVEHMLWYTYTGDPILPPTTTLPLATSTRDDVSL